MSYEPTDLAGFKKTIKTAPKDARVFPNGDISIAREYVKGQVSYAYYGKSKTGYKFERTFWKGRAMSGYNHCKLQPGFVPPTPKTGTKPKPAVKSKKPKALPKVKSPVNKESDDLQARYDAMQIKLDNAIKMLNDLGHGVK